MNSKIFLVVYGLLVTALVARPQGTLAWYFDTTEFVARSTDRILVTATVTNLTAQPSPMSFGGASFGGPLQYFYDFAFTISISDSTLPGYGSRQFSFGTLTPIGGYVPPGTYFADPARINFTQIPSIGLLSENTFQITVVPEPSALGLVMVGMACVCARRRLKR